MASYVVVIVVIFHTLIFSARISAKKVTLLDSSEKSSLRWATWSNHINGSSTAKDDGTGWVEESLPSLPEGVNSRSYVTCDISKEQVDNWLRLNYTSHANAQRLNVEIKFAIRDCKQFPHTALTCKETFSLYYYETDEEPRDNNAGPRDVNLFKRIARITSDTGRFTDRSSAVVSTEVRSVAATKKGVYFAFRDEGACISLLNVKIFYDVCEETTTNYAWFAETPVGASMTSIQETVGRCVDNASPPSGAKPKYVCKADGSWDLLSGGCQCNPGYRAESQRCIACDVNTFKESPGFGLCQPCPDHSRVLTVGSAVCQCDAGYYRGTQDSKSDSCTRPPSRPENPQIVSVDHSSAVVTWTKPSNFGGRKELWYRIECRECPSTTRYNPPPASKFNATKLTLSNLEPSTVYTVMIYAENDVSSQIDALPMYAVAEIATKNMSPLQISNLKIESVSENQITLSWDPPPPFDAESQTATGAGGPPTLFFAEYDTMTMPGDWSGPKRMAAGVVTDRYVQYYQIKQSTRNGSNTVVKTSNEPKITMQGLTENMEYVFEVEASNVSPSDHKRPVLVAVVVIGLIAFVLLVGVILFLRKRFRDSNIGVGLRSSSNKECSDLDALEYNSGERVTSPDYNFASASLNRKLTVPLMPTAAGGGSAGYRPYVDPTTYEDPTLALRDFANEIDANDVIIEEVIGGGEFGDVCKGRLRVCDSFTQIVAIKTLKPGSSEKAKLDFLTEASIMGQFNHPNVVRLKGVVTKLEPIMIITEYAENRSLDSFLRMNDGKLNVLQLVTMLKGIAQGMKYLSDKGYVHRDLAARNVLVDAHLNCKIADFGLSRTIDGSLEHAYTTKGGKIPVRWTAPEAITYRKFTSASDVWSYGVVMWEVMSFGERPYWDWPNQDVIQAVEQGYRLPGPMDCPQSLHRLMLDCWNRDRQLRPSFSSITMTLNNYLHCPELLYSASNSSISNSLAVQALIHQNQHNNNQQQYQHNHNQNNSQQNQQNLLMKMAGVDDFLRQIGLYERYATTFRHRGIKTALELNNLTSNDFSSWGVRREDQLKIADALLYFQQQKQKRHSLIYASNDCSSFLTP